MKQLPIGIDDFKELIDLDKYYIDKSQLIVDCIGEKCALYTRPRRFGKSLNMSMLYYFFSNKEKENSYLFDGLEVTKYPEVMKHQNQYPVIFLTLKDMKRTNYYKQLKEYKTQIVLQAKKYTELIESPYLLESEKKMYQQYIDAQIELDDLEPILFNLTYLLQKHFKQKVIVLIDEYDVPLQAAYQNGYYDEMVEFLKAVFSSTLKTNVALEKGIMTGCLRISKESIFTGLNNFKVYSILDKGNEECFGFTENEVKKMLEDYHLGNCFDEVKKWYDGYLFGDKEIYNPWSIISYVDDRVSGQQDSPVSYWANTSGNDIVYNYIKNATPKLKEEFETLLQGGTVIKEIKPELTYREMDDINNIYSFLLLTGYLKVKSKIIEVDHEYNRNKTIMKYELIIPNEEIYYIYRNQFSEYFKSYVSERIGNLYQGLIEGNAKQVMKLLNEILSKSISYYDNKESFYHGFLTGLFSGYNVVSNKESGEGRFDLCILPEAESNDTVVLIECKHSSDAKELVQDALKGANQIVKKNYKQDFECQGYSRVEEYGIAFYKKRCYVTQV